MTPRIIDVSYGKEFARQRVNVVTTAREHLDDEKEALEEVGEWLDEKFSESVVREILERKRRMNRAKANGQSSISFEYRRPHKKIKEAGLPGDNLRADRLEQAIGTLLGSNQAGKPLRILGDNIPRKERRPNAMRVVVVAGCIVDPDAEYWIGTITPLAKAPWAGDHSASPWIKGRADVLREYGYDAMKLTLEAFKVLGWEVEIDPGYQIRTGAFQRFITGTPKPAWKSPTPPGKAPQDIEVMPDEATPKTKAKPPMVEEVVETETDDPMPSGPVAKLDGWTKAELVTIAKFSDTTFDTIREAANVDPRDKGGKGPHQPFTPDELCKMVAAVEAGTFRRKFDIAKLWNELLAT